MCFIMDTNSYHDVIDGLVGKRRGISALYAQKHYIKISLRYNKRLNNTNK